MEGENFTSNRCFTELLGVFEIGWLILKQGTGWCLVTFDICMVGSKVIRKTALNKANNCKSKRVSRRIRDKQNSFLTLQ